MNKYKYFNTIWNDRDQEFYWIGHRIGFTLGAMTVATLCIGGLIFVDWVKNRSKCK